MNRGTSESNSLAPLYSLTADQTSVGTLHKMMSMDLPLSAD